MNNASQQLSETYVLACSKVWRNIINTKARPMLSCVSSPLCFNLELTHWCV
jgi:hypothetical protein